MEEPNVIIPLPSLATRWGCEVSTLKDARFRRRVGLPLVRIGGRLIGAFEADVTAIEQRGRELVEV